MFSPTFVIGIGEVLNTYMVVTNPDKTFLASLFWVKSLVIIRADLARSCSLGHTAAHAPFWD